MKKLILSLLAIVLMTSCNNVTELPQVVTTNAVITDTAIYLGGDVTFTGGDRQTVRGICWSTNPNPTTADNFLLATTNGTGEYSIALFSELERNTTYFFKAVAENKIGKSYGEELSVEVGNINSKGAYINERGCLVCDNYEEGETFIFNGEEYIVATQSSFQSDLNSSVQPNLFCTSKLTFLPQFSTDFNYDISSWDVSNITDMSWLFLNSSFNQDIGNWDVSSVVTMNGLFASCSAFNQDLSEWDVSNVENMRYMFNTALSFDQDISEWNVSSVTNMDKMFKKASSFNQDLNDWDVSSVTNMEGMFEDATAFNGHISDWNVGLVTNFQYMFDNASNFNQDIGGWDVTSVTDIEDMKYMFYDASAFNQDLSNWCVSNLNVQPFWFSTNSALTAANHPVWGTCP